MILSNMKTPLHNQLFIVHSSCYLKLFEKLPICHKLVLKTKVKMELKVIITNVFAATAQ